MRRLLIVYNPNSTNYKRVKTEVFPRIKAIKGYQVGKFAIEKTSFESNVIRLAEFLADTDIVISAGGDATSAISANAIVISGKDVTLGVLPYGNFNDLARTLGTMKYEDVFPLRSASVHALYPLDIMVDGIHWRYATCYVTMGMTAESVAIFDEPKFRHYMQKGHKSSWRSYLALATWYFKNRHKKQFIPDFSLNGQATRSGTSDYCAISGRSMCRVMKGANDYLKPKIFRSETCRLTSFPRLFKLMVASIFVRVPGSDTTRDVIKFNAPAIVNLQAEGESCTFEGVRSLTIAKSPHPLKVITKEKQK